jgi:hypothetical protein
VRAQKNRAGAVSETINRPDTQVIFSAIGPFIRKSSVHAARVRLRAVSRKTQYPYPGDLIWMKDGSI